MRRTFAERLVNRVVLVGVVLALSAVFGVAAAADTPARDPLSALRGLAAAAPPAEPDGCRGRNPRGPVRDEGEHGTYDWLCGSSQADEFTTRGGGDHVYARAKNDTIKSRDRKADEIWGGPGKGDFADTDPCDTVAGVEKRKIGAARCPGVNSSGGHFFQTGELPYYAPVAECWTETDGTRVMTFLSEPQVRALDVTRSVDFQTVAWQGVLLKYVGAEWQVAEETNWYWDRPYDTQVEAFAGNFWRSYTTGQRTFTWFEPETPGVYALGVRIFWYKTASAPQRETVADARRHYGDNEQAGHGACEFPA